MPFTDWSRIGRNGTAQPFVLAALVTPFRGDGIDIEGFEENIRYLDAMGLDGVLVAGTTGEREKLTRTERDELVRCARAVLDDDMVILGGLLAEAADIDAAMADLQQLKEAGANLALVAPPAPKDFDEEVYVFALSQLAANAPLGVLAYHPPSYRSRPFSEMTIRAIGKIPGLSGVKDSVGDADLLASWRPGAPGDGWAVFAGNAELFLSPTPPVTGGILALASAEPELFLAAARARGEKDEATLRILRSELGPLLERFRDEGLPALKEMLEERGLFGGEMRS